MRKWNHKFLFGYLHYFILTMGDAVLRVKKIANHLPNWTAVDVNSGELLAHSGCSFETVDAAMDGAEKWAEDNGYS